MTLEGEHTCNAPKDLTLAGIGGARCGAPADKLLPTGWYCEPCYERIKVAVEGGKTLLNLFRDALKKPSAPKS